MNQQLEILAPAGGREQLTAAVVCGAHAVYLGGVSLNARRGAAGFEGEALREAVEYCHIHGVKVHLTLNTVVLEKELPEAMDFVKTICELGVDAVIVQDLGLARLIRAHAPDLPLHASTQMAVHNLSGAKQLEALGFARVVLAREMSYAEIARVVQGTRLETEVFVHGALCMCMSGQCYMSAIIGERSGNRGLCAQPCRLPFYMHEKGRCDLSLKDLSIVEQLQELRELGVTSVKIEGRMKRPEYVAAAVTACKNALAQEPLQLERLQSVFSRSGFTAGYYNAQLGNDMFGTRQKEDVVSATKVLGELAQLYRKEEPRVALRASFALSADKPAQLTLEDEDGNTATAQGECPQVALNKPTTQEMVGQSLNKLGGTPYYMESLDIVCGDDLMLPVSQLNVLRREAVEAITAKRAQAQAIDYHETQATPQIRNNSQGNADMSAGTTRATRLRARFAKAEQIPLALVDVFEALILPVREAAKITDPLLLRKLVVELPRVSFEDYRDIQPALAVIKARGVTRALAGNIGGLWFAKQQGFTVKADFALNITNSSALAQVAELGCEDATVSFELNLNNIKHLVKHISCGIIGYGYLPLMLTRNCPVKLESNCTSCTGIAHMKDRLGNSFAVGCGGEKKYAEVYNHVPLYLADRLPELAWLSFLTLYFTTETQQECARITHEYQYGGKRENLTRGLYYRNIQ